MPGVVEGAKEIASWPETAFKGASKGSADGSAKGPAAFQKESGKLTAGQKQFLKGLRKEALFQKEPKKLPVGPKRLSKGLRKEALTDLPKVLLRFRRSRGNEATLKGLRKEALTDLPKTSTKMQTVSQRYVFQRPFIFISPSR
jgi:hypothetical protein